MLVSVWRIEALPFLRRPGGCPCVFNLPATAIVDSLNAAKVWGSKEGFWVAGPGGWIAFDVWRQPATMDEVLRSRVDF
jgi:hypothetical protein